MAYLASPSATLEIIKKYDFAFQKKFGQNFLIDANIVSSIVEAADITKDDVVLEIGPGIGTMTQYLCESAKQVIAVEIDKMLIPILSETLADYDNVEVINKDVLKLDLEEIANKYNEGKPIKVVANLPYYITTPIVMELLSGKTSIDSITIMVQKEVAERMQANPGTKDYGALSLAVSYYATAKVMLTVAANCFMPRPNVDSSVIKLTAHNESPVDVADDKEMFKIIRASFNQRRKTLVNGLKNSADLSYSKEEIVDAINAIGKDERIRGEKLSLEEFAMLTNALINNRG